MKNEGSGAWVIVILAAFGIAFVPNSQSASTKSPRSSDEQQVAIQPAVWKETENELKSLSQALWDAAELHGEPEASSLEAVVARLRSSAVQVTPVVVSVPDPERGMALYYDQSIDALRRGAIGLGLGQRGFSVGRSIEQKDKSEPRYIVFQSATNEAGGGDAHQRSLIVALLVEESPVLGPDPVTLRTALGSATRILAAGAPLRMLGPFFSGSAGALRAELETSLAARSPARVLMITGSATSPSLTQRLKSEHVDLSLRRTSLSEALVLDHLVGRLEALHQGAIDEDTPGWSLFHWLDRLTSSLEGLRGSRHPKIAILHEFDTAFGAETGSLASKVIKASFPSSIAQLRREKLRKTAKDASTDPLSLRRTLELKVPTPDHKEPDAPLPASDVTPFTQELELAEELRRLCRLRVDYLILSATDPFDIIFLAEQVKDYCPRISLVVLGAEAIYRHPDLSTFLSGTLVAGAYPLLFDSLEWSEHDQSFALGGHIAQGFYNAWVTHLAEALPKRDEKSPLLGFSPVQRAPRCDAHLAKKPVWITKIRGGAFWPLDVTCLTQEGSVASSKAQQLGAVRATGIARVIGAPILLFVAVILLAQWAARRKFARVPFARLFSDVPPEYIPLQSRYSLGVNLSLCVLLIVTLPTAFAITRAVERGEFYYWCGAFLGLACALALGVLSWLDGLSLFRTLLSRGDAGKHQETRRRSAAAFGLFFGGVLAWLGVAYPLRFHGLPELRQDMAIFRALEPLGMSPLLPLGHLALGFLLWGLFGLRRVRATLHHTLEAPLVLRRNSLDAIQAGREENEKSRPSSEAPLPAFENMRSVLEQALSGDLWVYEALTLTALLSVGAYFVVRLRPTWEGLAFDWLFRMSYSVLFGLVAFALVHLVALSALFSCFLRQVAALPIIEACNRISIKMTSTFGAQIGMRVPSFSELRISRYSARMLATLARELSQVPEAPYSAIFSEIHGDLEEHAKIIEHAFADDDLSSVDEEAGHVALYQTSQFLSRVLHRLWDLRVLESPPKTFESLIAAKDLLIGGPRASLPTVALYEVAFPERVLPWVRMAEDFVALRVATSTSHVIFHLRALLGFAVIGCLLLLLAASHYPFEPAQFVAIFGWGLSSLVILAGLVLIVRMEQNEVLSRLSGSRPGRLDFNLSFLSRILVYVGLPLLAVIASTFPELRDTLFVWLRPISQFLP